MRRTPSPAGRSFPADFAQGFPTQRARSPAPLPSLWRNASLLVLPLDRPSIGIQAMIKLGDLGAAQAPEGFGISGWDRSPEPRLGVWNGAQRRWENWVSSANPCRLASASFPQHS